jgi:hypothetical protein
MDALWSQMFFASLVSSKYGVYVYSGFDNTEAFDA